METAIVFSMERAPRLKAALLFQRARRTYAPLSDAMTRTALDHLVVGIAPRSTVRLHVVSGSLQQTIFGTSTTNAH